MAQILFYLWHMLVRMLYRNLCKCSYFLSGTDVQIWCIIMKNSFLVKLFILVVVRVDRNLSRYLWQSAESRFFLGALCFIWRGGNCNKWETRADLRCDMGDCELWTVRWGTVKAKPLRRFDSGHSSKGIFELWAWILMLKIGILIPSYKYPKQEQKRYQMEQSLWFCGTERYLHRICVIPRQYCNCDEHHDGHRHWHSYHPHGQWPAIIIIFMIVISCYKEDWDDKTVGGLPRPIMGHTAHTSCLLIIIINHQGGILDDHSWWLAIVSIRNKWDRYKMKGHSLQSSVLLVKHTKVVKFLCRAVLLFMFVCIAFSQERVFERVWVWERGVGGAILLRLEWLCWRCHSEYSMLLLFHCAATYWNASVLGSEHTCVF